MTNTYIELINHFWDVDIEYSYSAYEAKLYFAILQIANRLRWKEPLSIPNARLIAMVRCDKKTFIKARQRLIDTHLINYKSASTRKAGKYWWNISPNNAPNQGTNLTPNQGTNTEPISPPIVDPYIRLRLDKDKREKREERKDKKKEIISLYNTICEGLPKAKYESETRNALIEARWKEHPSLEFFKSFFEKVKNSDFLMGKINSFHADLDWLMKPSNFVKVLEDKYANREAKDEKRRSDKRGDEWIEKFKNPAGRTISNAQVEAIVLHSGKN